MTHRIVRTINKMIKTEHRFIFTAIYELIFQTFLKYENVTIYEPFSAQSD